ncbi:hypothetical protein [Nocardioides renjunii]|uniref:hypothetical protein n=1 Tax=Nocardioides renjunii TaxID=3095075 RepID=UPI002AFE8694|nr:hypothetical protein [Nocardioides sp. S-34]WQQ22156.1 hypothetical protein SHK17_19990 [Nocardioides sp. S-34]
MTSAEADRTGRAVSDGDARPHGRWPLYWFAGAVVCVLGPYVVGGIRTEQLALYGSAVVAVLLYWRHARVLLPGAPVLALWASYALVAAVGGLTIESRLEWGSGSLVAGLDNALLPLATMTAVAFWTRVVARTVLLRTASWVVVGAMALNGAIAVLTSVVGVEQLSPLRAFWAASGSEATVAELAAGSGRFSGVFNQPAEAGVAYSLAAFCVVYLVRSGTSVPRRVWLALWVLVILGGVMTLSKIFIVGGVLITLGLVLTGRPHRRLLTASAALTVAGSFTLGALGWLGTWGASGMLGWYVWSAQAGNSWLYTLSAGRFGAGSAGDAPTPTPEPEDGSGGVPSEFEQPGGLVELAREVLLEHPVVGVGAKGLPVSYDSTWIEAIVVAGVVGALLVLAVHVVLLIQWIRLRQTLPREEWRLAGAIVLLVWGSSFGMPSLTGNRESTLLWIFLSILVVFTQRGSQWDRTLDSAP